MSTPEDVLAHTADIAAAYVSNNQTSLENLPKVIAAIQGVLGGNLPVEPAADVVSSAPMDKNAVKRSITGPKLISFIDGKGYSTLKRHLTTNGMTPETYKAKYGLPADYPMTAPDYAAARSALAKSLGLGRKGGAAAADEDPTA